MTSLPLVDVREPPVRVMALHALASCPRLFYLEADISRTVSNLYAPTGISSERIPQSAWVDISP
jgi:hypothetical protein